MNPRQLVERNENSKGISLIEVLIIIVAVGLLVSVAMRSMTALLKDARQLQTEREMDMLAKAIVGDPSIMSVAGGIRSDFGYVGDVGALPDSLGALANNPGLGTWDGPYLPTSLDEASGDFRLDGWGVAYTYSGGVTITSTGSESSIVKQFAESSTDLLSNTVMGIIRDAADSLSTETDTANIDVVIIFPDGIGGLDTVSSAPSDTGWFTLTSIPIGRHPLMVIYTPTVDTLIRYVSVMPRHSGDPPAHFNFDSTYFSTPPEEYVGLTLVDGSDTLSGSGGGSCNNLRFWIENGTDDPVQVNTVLLEYTATAYYSALDLKGDADYEFEDSSNRNGSGDLVSFSPAVTIPPGDSTVVVVETFKTTESGTGAAASMENETITVTFSDGSTFDVTFDYCE